MKPDDLRTSDDSWRELEDAWQSSASSVSQDSPQQVRQILRFGRRQVWLRRFLIIGELAVCLIFGGVSVSWFWTGVAEKVAAIFVLGTVVIVGALRYRFWFDRGPDPQEPPQRFVEQLLAQNTRGFHAVVFGQRLLAIEVLFFLVWLPWRGGASPLRPLDFGNAYGFLAIWTMGFVAALWISRRILDRQRRQLEQMRAELAEEDCGTPADG